VEFPRPQLPTIPHWNVSQRVDVWHRTQAPLIDLPGPLNKFLDLHQSRITGFGTQLASIQWKDRPGQTDIAASLLAFLADRRLFSAPLRWETVADCKGSAIRIRDFISQNLPNTEEFLSYCLSAMREACHEFQAAIENPPLPPRTPWESMSGSGKKRFEESMLRLRLRFGVYGAYVSAAYGVDITGALVDVVPQADFFNPSTRLIAQVGIEVAPNQGPQADS
jgi:hypothetical protein